MRSSTKSLSTSHEHTNYEILVGIRLVKLGGASVELLVRVAVLSCARERVQALGLEFVAPVHLEQLLRLAVERDLFGRLRDRRREQCLNVVDQLHLLHIQVVTVFKKTEIVD